jgi:hypothetical protein
MILRGILFLSVCCLSLGFCQGRDVFLTGTVPLSSDRQYFRGSVEIVNFENGNDSRTLMLSFASVSVMRDNNRLYHVSLNPLITIAGLLLGPAFYIPQVYPNIRIQPNLYKEHIRGMLGLNTDYFMFYKNSKIYSEAFVGIKASYERASAGVHCCIPISRGYLKNKTPYVCLMVSYNIEQDKLPQQSLKPTE